MPNRPKIGLALSGGGAKGLAHIGILKAIDSAGLKIDYITGTSMGSIIGGLYAIGYSGDTIEKLAQTIDWDILLSNQSALREIRMEEKEEYSKYAIELPWRKKRFRLPTGVLEGQELWLKLSELFAPVNQQKDFLKFNIPFQCIGTDIGNGEPVILNRGEIVSAIRASMAIPSIFTAVDFEGKRLVDGGIVKNFPAQEARDMGAAIVIGSDVTDGLLPSQKVQNALQILLQIAFFREAADKKQQVAACDIYIPFHFENYSAGSFQQSDAIIQAGLEEGRRLFPQFKQLADSLNNLYGNTPKALNRLPVQSLHAISIAEIKGLEHTSREFFLHTIGFKANRQYTVKQVSEMVRKAFGTRYYNYVHYHLQQLTNGTNKIVFDVQENALTFAKLGLHYNRFAGISLIANITSRNLFLKNSRSLLSFNLGESFRVKGEHLQYLGKKKAFSLLPSIQFHRFPITTYDGLKQNDVYNQNYFILDGKIQYTRYRKMNMGVGGSFEVIRYKPFVSNDLFFRGHNEFSSAYIFLNYNTLNRLRFPKRGIKIETVAGRVFKQDPDISFYFDDLPVEGVHVATHPYYRSTLHTETYTPLNKKITLLMSLQAGINFNYENNIMNEFVVGGLNKTFRNQITFAGLREGAVSSPSIAAYQLGLRSQPFNNIFVTGRVNAIATDFINHSNFFQTKNFYSGASLTFSYDFPLGPLDLSIMYSPQTKKYTSYINLGMPL
ncbi:MAG TPA: patatin-like phospholipase family protein [Flavisolibacter sp.]|nr:patatin-like phospholipase family protein [Flavisolibacter sp.]